MSKYPYWLILLKNLKKSGLTIPFILGAKQYFDKDCQIDTVEKLFLDIKNSNFNEVLELHFCPDIVEFVFSIGYRNFKRLGVEIKNSDNDTTLILTISTEILGKNLEEIVSKLSSRYKQHLEKEEYSFTKRNWVKYTEIETNEIKALSANTRYKQFGDLA
ncbi:MULTISPECIES: hypothetical protein [Flavobacterium]|uniref:Uncharacterized protein n=1 Tax=Flavobacterium gawalongense TaxID=2594432 RepID=A0ABY3CES8_9FLAO|nr:MULTISPECIES: hypothetical protein [Flavobacterium]TRW88674.1 hypothetical protein FNW07_13640 [Flavobacterium sp. GT3R68]TRX01654.1 hypothetical protein FNW12_16910 [Flavobacterium gawalongense]